jgi:aspartyl-tRNA(Asn)/glutamyl-tRNA(Gln) amidotransferase subunit A
MAATDLVHLTIAEAARLIAAREISPVALTERLLERIEAIDPQINSFLRVTGDLARKLASEAEAEIGLGRYRGALHGIPLGLKDIYDVAGVPTTGHSRISSSEPARRDAATSLRLLAAGGVLLGKLATDEFAHGGPSFDLPWPPARNPWNPMHTASGSSSGSAAAVAAGLVLGAMGSDTGGSIRLPAAQNGVVGLKPTFGLISRAGVIPNSFSFDYCGPMTWTVEDCAIMLQVLAGHDPQDPDSVACPVPDYRAALGDGDVRGLRIGVVRHFWEEDVPASETVRRATEDALAVLRDLGAELEDVRLRPRQDYFDVKFIIAESEIFSIHYKDLQERIAEFGADFVGKISLACLFHSTDYVQAQRRRREMLEEMRPIYRRYDALVTAGPEAASRLDATRIVSFWEKPNITTPFNVLAGPALMVCCGFDPIGLPLSLQIVGRPFDEAGVLRIGHAYERATDWRRRRPALVEGAAVLPVSPPGYAPPTPDPLLLRRVEMMVEQAGLRLTEPQLVQLCEEAPYGFAMSQRIRRDHHRTDHPANILDRAIWDASLL